VPTEPRRRRAKNAGFTLVEVLIAFVILAIGLLAIEALGIGASRLVTRAQRMADYSTWATSKLESSLDSIRQGFVVAGATGTLSGGTWERTVTSSAPATGVVFQTIRISVRPTASNILAASDSISVTGNVLN